MVSIYYNNILAKKQEKYFSGAEYAYVFLLNNNRIYIG